MAIAGLSHDQALQRIQAHVGGDARLRERALRLAAGEVARGGVTAPGLAAWLMEAAPGGLLSSSGPSPDLLGRLSQPGGFRVHAATGEAVPARLGAVRLRAQGLRVGRERILGLGTPDIDWSQIAEGVAQATRDFAWLCGLDDRSSAGQLAFKAWSGITGQEHLEPSTVSHWAGGAFRRKHAVSPELREGIEQMMLRAPPERKDLADPMEDVVATEARRGLERRAVLLWFSDHLASAPHAYDGIRDRLRSGELPWSEGCRQLEDAFGIPRGALQPAGGEDLFDRLVDFGGPSDDRYGDESPLERLGRPYLAAVVNHHLSVRDPTADASAWFTSPLLRDAHVPASASRWPAKEPVSAEQIDRIMQADGLRFSDPDALGYAALAERLGLLPKGIRANDMRARLAWELLRSGRVPADHPHVRDAEIDRLNAEFRPEGADRDALLGGRIPRTPSEVIGEKLASALAGGIYPGESNGHIVRKTIFRAERLLSEIGEQKGLQGTSHHAAHVGPLRRAMECLGCIQVPDRDPLKFEQAHKVHVDDRRVYVSDEERALKRLAFEVMIRPELAELYRQRAERSTPDEVVHWFRSRRGFEPSGRDPSRVGLLNAKDRVDVLVDMATRDLDDAPANQIRHELRTLAALTWGRASSNGSAVKYFAELATALREGLAGDHPEHVEAVDSEMARRGFSFVEGAYELSDLDRFAGHLRAATSDFTEASTGQEIHRFMQAPFDPAILFRVIAP